MKPVIYNKEKFTLISVVGAFFVMALFMIGVFIESIYLYFEYKVEYDDLTYGELSFSECERLQFYKWNDAIMQKSGYKYIVYFEEYGESFEISKVCNKKLDIESLEKIKTGEKLQVYYKESHSRKFDYEIFELKRGSKTLLSLDDCVEKNLKNQVMVMIMCPICAIGAIALAIFFIWFYRDVDRVLNNGNFVNLGSEKVRHLFNGNTISVYNSKEVCSLVFNNKVVDKYEGVSVSRFSLKGTLKAKGRDVLVEAKMGYLYLYFYIDGKLIKKAFMGFG